MPVTMTLQELNTAMDKFLSDSKPYEKIDTQRLPSSSVPSRLSEIDGLLHTYDTLYAEIRPDENLNNGGKNTKTIRDLTIRLRRQMNTRRGVLDKNKTALETILSRTSTHPEYDKALQYREGMLSELRRSPTDELISTYNQNKTAKLHNPEGLDVLQTNALNSKDQEIETVIKAFRHDEALLAAIAARQKLIDKLKPEATPPQKKQTMILKYDKERVDTQSAFNSPLLTAADRTSRLDTLDQEIVTLTQPIRNASLQLALAARQAVIDALSGQKTFVDKDNAIAAYNDAKDKAPFESLLITDAMHTQTLAPQDATLDALIIKHQTARQTEVDRRKKAMGEKAKPALQAMEKKVADLTTKVKEAWARLDKHPGIRQQINVADAKAAHEAALLIYTRFNALYERYIDLHINLATFKKEAEQVVNTTKWVPQLEITAANVLAKHRGHQGTRSFKQWAYEFLKGLGLPGAANYLFATTSTKTVAGFVNAVNNEKDTPSNKK